MIHTWLDPFPRSKPMPDEPTRTGPIPWARKPIIDWLVDEGRLLPDINELVRQLGDRMLAGGAPLWRLRLSMRTLHPLLAGISSVWERDRESPAHIESPHGIEGRSGYIGSPLEIIARTRAPFRKLLAGALSNADHNVLHDLKARGGTDYYGLPMKFSDATSATLVFTTDVVGGFSASDIECFTEIASVLAPITEVFRSNGASLAVAEAYLGPRTGRRVLAGQITRGHIERVNAAILVSDIRDWTGLNNRVGPEQALALANRYFETIAEAVEPNGGEILKFIGDGVLAIFSTDSQATDAVTVCEGALAAAKQALRMAQQPDWPPNLTFGIGIHFGEVLYGNIGSKTRLDFTVLGQAVNTAARIEGLCNRFGEPVLFSQDFADRLTEPTRLVAEETFKGHDVKSKVFATTEDPQSDYGKSLPVAPNTGT